MSFVYVFAVDLGGVLLSDPTRGAFWSNVANGDPERATRARAAWFSRIRVPFELGEISEEEGWRQLADASGAPPDAVRDTFLSGFEVLAQGQHLLQELSASGKPIILATNHRAEWLPIWRRKYAWFANFKDVVCSSEIGFRKPDEGFYDVLIHRSGVSAERIALIDDDESNIRGAQDVGMQAVLVDPACSDPWDMGGILP
jgi:FMN phosphatase YigB (HAD superfamily)